MKSVNESQDGNIELSSNDQIYADSNRRGAILNDYIAMESNIVDEYIDVKYQIQLMIIMIIL